MLERTPALLDPSSRQRGIGLGGRHVGHVAHVLHCEPRVHGPPGAVDRGRVACPCCPPQTPLAQRTRPSAQCRLPQPLRAQPRRTLTVCCQYANQVLCGKLRKRDVERQLSPLLPIDIQEHDLPWSPPPPVAFDMDALIASRPEVTPVASPLVSPVLSRSNSFADFPKDDGPGAYERHSILDGTSCYHMHHRKLALAGACLRCEIVLCCFVHSDVKLMMGGPTTICNQVGCKGFVRYSHQSSNHTLYATRARCESCASGGAVAAQATHYPCCARIPFVVAPLASSSRKHDLVLFLCATCCKSHRSTRTFT